MEHQKKIIIVGAGFGGIRAALDLSNQKPSGTKIVLISDKPHFEYHALLYRVLTGRSPLEVCIPLKDIFEGRDVEVVEDTITEVDVEKKTLKGASESHYRYDVLVLALGSENAYFNTPGLKELSFSVNSIAGTLKLKRHLHEVFSTCEVSSADDKTCQAHIIIVGGGVTGCEVAGELALYARELAIKHNIDPSFVTIDLIHSGSRLMSALPEDISEATRKRLYSLGVNIFLNRRVMKEEIEQVYLKDMEMKSKTLIWSAGVKPSSLYSAIKGLQIDKKGRVEIDEHLQAKGVQDVYIAGDGAATEFSGMAQTALNDGAYIARHIKDGSTGPYVPIKPNYVIPVGPGWATGVYGGYHLQGTVGWMARKWTDLKFFMSILPLGKAITAFRHDKILWETCPVCSNI